MNDSAGGLVGYASGDIENNYATGTESQQQMETQVDSPVPLLALKASTIATLRGRSPKMLMSVRWSAITSELLTTVTHQDRQAIVWIQFSSAPEVARKIATVVYVRWHSYNVQPNPQVLLKCVLERQLFLVGNLTLGI